MSDDMQEIISRPPSHPIATSLLVCSIAGTIVAIMFVWWELFGEYLPTPAPGQQNDSRTIAEQHLHDHYKRDFKGGENVLADVEKELGIGSKVGGDAGLGAATGGGGGGGAPAGEGG